MKKAAIWLLNAADKVIPKRNKLLLRGYPDLEDQCLSVLMALARRGFSAKVIWVMRSGETDIAPFVRHYGLESLALTVCGSSSLQAIIHFLTARWVFFTHGTYSQGDWGNYVPPRRKTVVNLWHGMPIKSIWRFLPVATEPPRADALLATSPRFQQVMIEASGMSADQVWVTGLPRNDLLYHRSPHAEEAIRQLVGACPWFLYLPTYRKSREGYLTEDGCEHDSVLSMSDADMHGLDRWLQANGVKLIVKAHPLSIHAGLTREQKTDNIVVISENWLVNHHLTLYVLAGYSSGLITDLSSIAVDYLLLDKPVFVYFPDLDEYLRGRGTVFDQLEDNLPGEICGDVTSLIEEMDAFQQGDDRSRERRSRLLAEWHAEPGGGAADRLLDLLGIA